MSEAAGRALVAKLVERAALDGSTCLPAAVVAASLRAAGTTDPDAAIKAAAEAGTIVSYADEQLVGHVEHAGAEARLAAQLARLAPVVVDVPRGTEPGPVLAPMAVESAGGRVVDRADRLDLAAAVRLAEELPDGAPLVLVGDPGLPPSPAPGQVLVDVVASSAVRVIAAPLSQEGPDRLATLVQSLRAGTLPSIDPDRREVVVTPAAEPGEAVRRAVQLATDSVPRVFDTDPGDVLVLAPRVDGSTGVEALRTALSQAGADGVEVCGCAEAAGREAEAIVLVLGADAAGSLTRDLLLGAATEARRHLSVVHQAGPALAEAVARRPHRARRTRLAALLATGLG